MCSSRRAAQLGLGAACLILVSSVAVLVGGATSPATSPVGSNNLSPATGEHGYAAMAVVDPKPADSLPKH